jgi:hypothetical protein
MQMLLIEFYVIHSLVYYFTDKHFLVNETMKTEYITVTFLIKQIQYSIPFALYCCGPICSNSTHALGGNIKKIQASFHCRKYFWLLDILFNKLDTKVSHEIDFHPHASKEHAQ